MTDTTDTWVLSEDYAGLQAQAIGLAEAAGLVPAIRPLTPRPPWRWFAASLWPNALAAVDGQIGPPFPDLAIGCGGVAASVGAALRRRGTAVVQVQHPRMPPSRFDLVVVNRHDELTGPNVLVTRTALHRVTQTRLAAAAAEWREQLAPLPRPLVAVLVGGNNGRFRFDPVVAGQLANQLAGMMRQDRVGVALTPSRRTDPAALMVLRDHLAPLGAFVWDGAGPNPYFGMLALADAIVVTTDSVSMISEAVATTAPVMLAQLPGHSRRNGLFTQALLAEHRVRPFAGRLEAWPVSPLNDTPDAAAEMCRRLGIHGSHAAD